jgi:transcriptional regulator with XRE-family HTH domain
VQKTSDPRSRKNLAGRFGKHLRTLRTERGLTQEVLAERSDLSVDGIRRIERGAFSPSLDTIGRLCTGLEISIATMFSSVELGRRLETQEISDLLASRSQKEIRLAWRLLKAVFDER